ncbi:MAG TPA: hypothetical protein DDW27_06050 [Bacteroidales bacterium]|nr:hypothetical protein [Bacteroidales bacterium]
MKIFFVIDTLGAGGKERRLTELLKALVGKQELKSELVVMSEDIHYNEIYDLGIPVHKVLRKTVNDPRVFRELYVLIKAYNPDIVHCWESMTAMYLAPVTKILNCILINGMVTNAPVRQNIFNKHWLRARLTFPFSEVVVSNSKAGLAAYRVPSDKGVVIYNGFNYDRIKNISDTEIVRRDLNISTRHIVGMVASFTQNKDYATYYNAAQSLLEKRSDVTFLAIGTGTDSEESYSMVEPGNRGHFRFLGRKSGIESYINAMDIGVLSTFTEGISNAILEYMAFGKPVVATDGGGTSEIVIDGVSGFLIRPSDPSMMADRILVLLNDIDLRRSMGQAGAKRIKESFTIEKMVNEYIKLYMKVLERSN